MEAIVIESDFLHEVEEHACAVLGVGDGVGAIVPWVGGGAGTEGIRAGSAHGVPVGAAETEPLGHGLTGDDLAGVVMFERERVFRRRTFVVYGITGKRIHGAVGLGLRVRGEKRMAVCDP